MNIRTCVAYYGPSPAGNRFSHAVSIDEAERKLQPLSEKDKLKNVVVTRNFSIPRWVKTAEGYQQVYCCSTAGFSSAETTVDVVREVLRRDYPDSFRTQNAWDQIKSNRWDRNAFATSEFSSIYLTT